MVFMEKQMNGITEARQGRCKKIYDLLVIDILITNGRLGKVQTPP